jgi:hypothetical protein
MTIRSSGCQFGRSGIEPATSRGETGILIPSDFFNSLKRFLLQLRCERMGISWKNTALLFSLAVSQMAWCQDKAQLHVTDITSDEKIYIRGRIGKISLFHDLHIREPNERIGRLGRYQ